MSRMVHDTLIRRTLPYHFHAAGCSPIATHEETTYANRRLLTLLLEAKFLEAT